MGFVGIPMLVSGLALSVSSGYAHTILYVDNDAPLGGNGTSWSSPFRYLQDAVAKASDDSNVKEIHVAGGVYNPDQDEAGNVTPGDRQATFQLISAVSLFGGYAGLSSPENPDERDVDASITLLSGDLNGNDGPDFANNGENSYHVVSAIRVGSGAVLDGFTVTAGNADVVNVIPNDRAGGMYNEESSAIINNCCFARNSAFWFGGGVFNISSNTQFTDCSFTENRLTANLHGSGGGMHNLWSDVVLVGCTFRQNATAGWGGGLYNIESVAVLRGCTFVLNSATGSQYGGGGGLYNHRDSETTAIDCTFSENFGGKQGGAVLNYFGQVSLLRCRLIGNESTGCGGGISSVFGRTTADSCIFNANQANWAGAWCNVYGSIKARNCTIVHNRASNLVGGVWNSRGQAEVNSCILWDNRDAEGMCRVAQVENKDGELEVKYSCIRGWDGSPVGKGNTGMNPLFISPAGADGTIGTDDDDLRLSQQSPCINVGDPSLADPDDLDLDKRPRLQGCRADMGTFESDRGQARGDFDDDMDFDLVDYGAYQLCSNADSTNQPWSSACLCLFDYDRSGYIDLRDFAAFQPSLDGPLEARSGRPQLPCVDGLDGTDSLGWRGLMGAGHRSP